MQYKYPVRSRIREISSWELFLKKQFLIEMMKKVFSGKRSFLKKKVLMKKNAIPIVRMNVKPDVSPVMKGVKTGKDGFPILFFQFR